MTEIVTTTIRLPRVLWEIAKHYCIKNRISFQKFVHDTLEEKLNEDYNKREEEK
jgi:hypothetical protein